MVKKKRGRREKRMRRGSTYYNKQGVRQEKGKINEQRAKKELNGSVGPN